MGIIIYSFDPSENNPNASEESDGSSDGSEVVREAPETRRLPIASGILRGTNLSDRSQVNQQSFALFREEIYSVCIQLRVYDCRIVGIT